MTLANRGKDFEEMLDAVHALYGQQSRAYVVRTNAPIRHVGPIEKSGTFRACYLGEGPPDYLCIVCGKVVVFEAKRTQQKRWSFSLLTDHQAAQLEAAETQGAVGAVMIRFVGIQARTVLLLWSELRNLWHPWRLGASGQASLSLDEAKDIALWVGVGADYLPALERHFATLGPAAHPSAGPAVGVRS